MSIHFANPQALWLLALVVPIVLWARRSMAGLGTLRRVSALVLRIAIVTLVVLALAGPQWSLPQDDLSVIYVVDQSLSIPPEARAKALDFVLSSQQERRRTDHVGMVVFGRSAALERRPGTGDLLKLPDTGERTSVQSVVSPERTGIAEALRLALAAFGPAGRKRIVLVSDGNENVGIAAEEAETARRNGVRIDVWPIAYAHGNEVMVEKVTSPSNADRGATFEVRTVVNAARPQSAKLRLYENGALIGSEEVALKTGRNVFFVERKLPEPGYYSYEATIETEGDTLYANNKAAGFTVVRGRSRVLLADSDPTHAENLASVLRRQGMDVKVVGLEALPLSLGQLIPYDAVILSNVPAGNLGAEGMRAVELAVKDWGVGLVMIGGENAFGPGGYQDSPVERALPVAMDIKQKRIMPSGALVVILHTCEIPQGNYWAQQIATSALNVLSSTDEFGVIYYGYQGGDQWLFPLQRVKDKQRLARLIASVAPGDMGSFIQAFKMAHKALNQSTASVKHVVVISDGDPAYPSDKAVAAMFADGITISTVGVFPHTGTETARLSHVAAIGGGRFYEPTDPASLPRIFIKEAATVRRSLIFEEPFRPTVAMASELTKGIPSDAYPTLEGYVLTEPKRLAEVPLVTPHKDPLLAHWQYGLGRAVAFTSDAKPRWAAQWLAWDRFEAFWAQVVRWVSRSASDAPLRVKTRVTDDRAHVLIDAIDPEGRFLNEIEFTGTLVTADARETSLRVEQTGPGRYEAAFDVGEAGTNYLVLHYTDAEGRRRLHTEGVVVPYSSEYRELQADTGLLARLAETTAGRTLTGDDEVFARDFVATPRYKEMWPTFLLIALLLVPVDVFVRRVFLDYAAIWRRIVAAALARQRAKAAPTHVSTLAGAKERARDRLEKRRRRFEPSADADAPPPKEPGLSAEPTGPKPKIAPTEAPKPTETSPAVERDDQTYTGRLLRAKRKAREDKDKDSDSSKDDSRS